MNYRIISASKDKLFKSFFRLSASRYTYHYKTVNDLQLLVLNDEKTHSTVELVPEIGARINTFTIIQNGKPHSIIKGFDSLEDLKNIGVPGYYGAILFPFPNRVHNGKYSYDEISYTLDINEIVRNHALHGLVHDQLFQIKEIRATDNYIEAVLSFQITKGFNGFPFSFSLDVTYTLSGNGDNTSELSLKTEVTNTGNKSFPAGFGWHPYIRLGTSIDNLNLQLPFERELQVDNRLIPTGNSFKQEQFQKRNAIQDLVFDTCFEAGKSISNLTTTIYNPNNKLGASFHQEKANMPYIQLYTPDERDCIAIEPMSCPANAFNSEKGLEIINPKETRSWQCQLSVSY